MELGTWFRLAWDRVVAVALIALGLLAVLAAWIGASGEAFPAKQVPYVISGGIAGVLIVGLGALFWVSGDMRDEWTKLDRIEDALNRLADSGLVDAQTLAEVNARTLDLSGGEGSLGPGDSLDEAPGHNGAAAPARSAAGQE